MSETKAVSLHLADHGRRALLWIGVITLIITASPPVSGLHQKPVQSFARVSISTTSHDFGQVFVGEMLTHIFTIQNSGSIPLTLSEKTARPAGLYLGPYRGAPS